jgi:hypothetical protein
MSAICSEWKKGRCLQDREGVKNEAPVRKWHGVLDHVARLARQVQFVGGRG